MRTSKINAVLCHGFIRYAKSYDLEGGARDSRALAFFAGAALALTCAGHADAESVSAFAIVVRIEGFEAISRVAASNP